MKFIHLQLSFALLLFIQFNTSAQEFDIEISKPTVINADNYLGDAARIPGDMIVKKETPLSFEGEDQDKYTVVEKDLILEEGSILVLNENTNLIIEGELIIQGENVILDIAPGAHFSIQGDISGNGKAYTVESPVIYTNGNTSNNIHNAEYIVSYSR
ncbi:hypothetical protein [Flammeovirga sp. SubArs3]|uniref:hypothetical protein n=1 Tax=Flammeovirga sp. SubArs3 TaxID=2995316 RepID=UPI00248C438C|nr:hypothetical protein [Flammeovirga sp. SubArs3]